MQAAIKMDEFDNVYDNISKLYDHAENLLNFSYHEDIKDHEEFVREIENVVNQIEESANIIADDIVKLVDLGEMPDNAMKRRVNSSLRKMLLSIEEYRKHIKSSTEE